MSYSATILLHTIEWLLLLSAIVAGILIQPFEETVAENDTWAEGGDTPFTPQ